MDPTESIIRSMDAAFDALFPQMRLEQRAQNTLDNLQRLAESLAVPVEVEADDAP